MILLSCAATTCTDAAATAVTATTTTTATTTPAAVTVCPKAGSVEIGQKYHSDSQCDRAAYTAFKDSLGRHETYRKFKAMGGVATVPNIKTVTCPAAGERVTMKEPSSASYDVGMDTVWFVENQASTPVVVSYLTAEGVEVSALNPHIVPAVRDPQAILASGSWMAVQAFEGHEFVVRQVLMLPGGAAVAGNVLLQHRVGLYPVGAHAALACPTDALEDKEPLVVNESDGTATTAPQFQRTAPPALRPCHTMDVGFRNAAGCPLHGYHVSGGGDACAERFKLHLGVQQGSNVPDYMNDWVSQTKYEGTFVGHTFHFRLASNPAVLVDTVTLSPVIVTDCPAASGAATATAVPQPLGAGIVAHTGDYADFVNATDSNQYYYAAAASVGSSGNNSSTFAKPKPKPAAGSI